MTDAAWFPDPDGSPGLRWWDGARWTASTWPPVEIPVARAEPVVDVREPAGWYEDPAHPAMLRWWDGRDWTDRLARVEMPRGPASDIGRGRATTIAVTAVAAVLVLGAALVVLS